MKSLSDIGQIISELEGWEKKYLPDNPQAGKIKLLDIVGGRHLKSVVSWLEYNHHQSEADKVKAEYSKIMQWGVQKGNALLSKNLDDNPFVADEKGFRFQLTDLLRSIRENIQADLAPKKAAEKKPNRKTTIVAIIISFIVDLVFELLVYFAPFTWVKNHPNSYGLQGSIIFLIPCLIVGLFKPQYRKWCWGVGAIAFIVLLLSLMGGPADSNVN